MTYSLDLREKAVGYIESGHELKEASTVFGVTTRTLSNWKRRKAEENLAPKARKSSPSKIDKARKSSPSKIDKARKSSPSKIDNDRLKEYIREKPDAYLREIAEEFGSTLQAVFYACRRLKITLKKRPRGTKNEMRKKERCF